MATENFITDLRELFPVQSNKPRFHWIFAAVPKEIAISLDVIEVVSVNADTEQEARGWYSDMRLALIAKIDAKCIVINRSNGFTEVFNG